MAHIKRSIKMVIHTYNRIHRFYKSIFFQCLIYNVIYFINSYMMGDIGEHAVSAIGIGTQFLWILQCIIQSGSSSVGLLISRSWGKKDTSKVSEQLISSILIVCIEFLVILCVLYFQMDNIIGFYTQNEMISQSLRVYLPIAVWELFFSGISMAYESSLQSTDQNKAVSKAYLLELLINVLVIIVFIEVLGLGIVGVAAASLLTKIIKLLYMRSRYKLGYSVNIQKMPARVLLLLKVSLPILIETFLWNAGSTIIMGTIGRLQIAEVTIYSIFTTTLYVLFVPLESFAKSVKIYLGQLFGNSNALHIKKEAKNLIIVNQIAIVITLAVTSLYYFNMQCFYSSLSTEAFATTYKLVPLILIYTALKGENELISNGFLQTGLDNTSKCIFECCMIIFTYVLLTYFNRDIFCVFLALIIIELLRLIIFALRTASGKWLVLKVNSISQ